MIELLIVTHGNFGKEILKSAEIIVGEQCHITTLSLFHGDNIDDFRDEVTKSIKTLDNDDGVLVLVDLFGGSPSNAVLMGLKCKNDAENVRFECITGLNMPMLLEAITMRGCETLEGLKERCICAGGTGIKDLRYEFSQC